MTEEHDIQPSPTTSVEVVEVVDGLPVVADHTRVLEPAVPALLPARQAAALAATGFAAGAVTAAVVTRRRATRPARRRKRKKGAIGEIVSSNSFLVDVHLLTPRLTASPWADAPVDVRVEVTPPWPFRIGRGSGDGILRRRGATLLRLLHVGDEPVLVAVAQTAPQRVLFAARCGVPAGRRRRRSSACASPPASTTTCAPFYDRFAGDPVIGKAVRSRPHVRIHRRAGALGGARVGDHRAADRARARARDPAPARRAARPPLPALRAARHARRRRGSPRWRRPSSKSLDLAARRALALRRAAREVAAGRVDLADREQAWPRLAAIPDVGPWTLEMLSLYGQGRYDLRPGRRPRLPQARRAPDHRQPEGARRRGRGARVLRALRGVEGPGGDVPGHRRRDRAAHGASGDSRVEPLARQELVGQRRRRVGCCLSSFCSNIQRP